MWSRVKRNVMSSIYHHMQDNPPSSMSLFPSLPTDSLEAVVVELVVWRQGDQPSPGWTQREEDLHSRFRPNLQQNQCKRLDKRRLQEWVQRQQHESSFSVPITKKIEWGWQPDFSFRCWLKTSRPWSCETTCLNQLWEWELSFQTHSNRESPSFVTLRQRRQVSLLGGTWIPKELSQTPTSFLLAQWRVRLPQT